MALALDPVSLNRNLTDFVALQRDPVVLDRTKAALLTVAKDIVDLYRNDQTQLAITAAANQAGLAEAEATNEANPEAEPVVFTPVAYTPVVSAQLANLTVQLVSNPSKLESVAKIVINQAIPRDVISYVDGALDPLLDTKLIAYLCELVDDATSIAMVG